MHRSRRRRLNARVFNAGFQPLRHQVGKIGWIGKKCEHQFHREGHPIAGFKSLHHRFDGIVRQTLPSVANKKSAGRLRRMLREPQSWVLPAGNTIDFEKLSWEAEPSRSHESLRSTGTRRQWSPLPYRPSHRSESRGPCSAKQSACRRRQSSTLPCRRPSRSS